MLKLICIKRGIGSYASDIGTMYIIVIFVLVLQPLDRVYSSHGFSMQLLEFNEGSPYRMPASFELYQHSSAKACSST